MKRAPELMPLSREHHEALVLARRACAGTDPVAVRQQVLRRWSQQIEAHIAVEEQVLLPARAQAGAERACADALRQHAQLRAYTELLRTGDLEALPLWGDAMREHVQFEERGLFTLAQEIVDLPRLAQGLERPTEITSE
jgi:hemerythrin-like domain-containing protein